MCIMYFNYTFYHVVHHEYHIHVLHVKIHTQFLISETNAMEWASLK